MTMNKEELETLLIELDHALVEAFPGPEPIEMLIVGGACLLFTNVTTRPTEDIDVIITNLLGTGKAGLVYNPNPNEQKVRDIIEHIGISHGYEGDKSMFLNDDCAPFLVELGGKCPECSTVFARKPAQLP
jgi:hypothetical protein